MISSLECETYLLPLDLWVQILMLMYNKLHGLFGHLHDCVNALFGIYADHVYTRHVLPCVRWLDVKSVVSNELLILCKELRHLHISKGDQRKDHHLQGLTKLTSLSLELEALPLKEIALLPKLRKMVITQTESTLQSSCNKLRGEISHDMKKWTNLCEMRITGKYLCEAGLKELTNLHTLHITDSLVEGESFLSLTGLTSLNLKRCPFVSTTSIACLTNLRSLTLYHYDHHPNFILEELAVLTQLVSLVVVARYPGITQEMLSFDWPKDKFQVFKWESSLSI